MTFATNTLAMLDYLLTAVIITDGDFRVQYANQSSLSIFSISERKILHEKVGNLFLHVNINEDIFYRALRRQENFSENDVEVTLFDGRKMLFDLSVSFFKEDEQAYCLIEAKPIDQQRKISRANQQQLQYSASKRLIRNLAHEIKNPLGGIRGAAQLLENELNEQELHDYTQMIIQQTDRLTAMVNRLLGPNSLPVKKVLNVHGPLESVHHLIATESKTQIEIVRDYDPSIPDFLLDDHMLQQVFLNICRNAVQAMKEIDNPCLTLQTRITRKQVINGQAYPLCATISIIDNGSGIAKEVEDTLFYPTVTNKSDGSGLGLSIAQNLVHHHHGRIDVDSAPGHTVFHIHLPILTEEKE